MENAILFVGLGNPGQNYEHTRHNVGFDAIDIFAKQNEMEFQETKFKGLVAKKLINGKQVILLKPLTFMNLSGDSVRLVYDFYKIDIDNVIVIHDDMDTPVGSLRMREKGSSGGHNGIKSIIAQLGTENFKRIKIGIGKAPYDTIDFVLGKPSILEKPLIDQALNKAANVMENVISEGFEKACSKYRQ